MPYILFLTLIILVLPHHPVWGVRGGTDNANLVRSGREAISGNLPWFAALVRRKRGERRGGRLGVNPRDGQAV
jgi:hypothetical protein